MSHPTVGKQNPGRPIDGGHRAWLSTFGAWWAVFITFGWVNFLGVFQSYYEQSIFLGKIFDNYGPRWLLIFGGLAQVLGLMMTSISTAYYQVFLSQAVCSALGASAVMYGTVGSLATWWKAHRATAYGIAFPAHPSTLAEDDDFRKHFKAYIKNNRSYTKEDKKKKKKTKKKNKEEVDDRLSPGILRNTFIVIPIEMISGNRNCEESDLIDPCWVSSEEETVMNGEKYQGRVKVAKWSLEAWFYAARWKGVSLKDMWLKAQRHPEKYWICYTKRLEEWQAFYPYSIFHMERFLYGLRIPP
ncbi:unnamed protein product, partial [Fusarium langsethiae]